MQHGQRPWQSESHRRSIQYHCVDLLHTICAFPATGNGRDAKDGPTCLLDSYCHSMGWLYDCELLPKLHLSTSTNAEKGFGFVEKWDQMVGLRVLLGVLEAGFFPGCAYLLSCWYPRDDLHKRNAVFYLIGSMASGFSGILAYGIMQMDGLADLRGWRWIFIVRSSPAH